MTTLRVLIAEDEGLVAFDLRDVIEAAGHEVCAVVTTAQDMLGGAEEAHPDVAFVDLQLADGLAVEAANELSRRFGTKIVLTTGFNPDDTVLGDFQAKPVDILLKPFMPEAVAAVLRRL